MDKKQLLTEQEWFERDMTLMSMIDPEGYKEKVDMAKDALYKEILAKPMMTGRDILRLPCDPNDYLVENLLWRDDVALVLAREKVGKSFFSSQMCYAMTVGKPFLGQFDVVKPLKVLYIQAEGSMSGTKERIENTMEAGEMDWNPDNWRHMFVARINLDTDEGYMCIENALNSEIDFIPDVVVIDPLYTAMTGDLSDNKSVRAFIGNVRRMMARLHCAVILVHHEHRGKTDQQGKDINEGDNAIMGSFAFAAFVNHILRLTWDKKGSLRKMKCTTQRNDNVVKELEFDLVKPYGVFRIPNTKGNSSTDESILRNIKHAGSTCANDVAEQTGMGISTVRKSFMNLLAKGKIEKLPKKGRTVLYKVKDGQ